MDLCDGQVVDGAHAQFVRGNDGAKLVHVVDVLRLCVNASGATNEGFGLAGTVPRDEFDDWVDIPRPRVAVCVILAVEVHVRREQHNARVDATQHGGMRQVGVISVHGALRHRTNEGLEIILLRALERPVAVAAVDMDDGNALAMAFVNVTVQRLEACGPFGWEEGVDGLAVQAAGAERRVLGDSEEGRAAQEKRRVVYSLDRNLGLYLTSTERAAGVFVQGDDLRCRN